MKTIENHTRNIIQLEEAISTILRVYYKYRNENIQPKQIEDIIGMMETIEFIATACITIKKHSIESSSSSG